MSGHPLVLQLAAVRHQRRISQQEISALSGITQPTISHWETGRRTPTIYALSLYARALGFEITLTSRGGTDDPHVQGSQDHSQVPENIRRP